jgi:glucokinase
MKVLAGDIGGTSTRLAIFEADIDNAVALTTGHYVSQDYDGLAAVVRAFMAEHSVSFTHACFGVAGPIREGVARPPNLQWIIDGQALAHELRLEHVWLINDLEANAYGIALLAPQDFAVIHAGAPASQGNAAVISAGTGLGEAGLIWDRDRLLPFACEGGHVDFAPRDAVEVELLRYLQARFEHVSYERIVSGPGLVNLYHFLRDSGREPESTAIAARMRGEDPAAVISTAALDRSCSLCTQALALWVRLYGAEAGNLALKMFATGGVFLGGGIAPKILSALREPDFTEAFLAKGRMRPLLETIPVSVILNPATALLGAARYGALQIAAESARR